MTDTLYRVFRDSVPSANFADYPDACAAARKKATHDPLAVYTVRRHSEGVETVLYRTSTINGLLTFTPMQL